MYFNQTGLDAQNPPYLARTFRLALIGLSWAVVSALVILSVFHLIEREPWTAVVALIAVTPWIYMVAWVTASVGLLYHRRTLAVVSAALVALQLWWVVPDFDPVAHLEPLSQVQCLSASLTPTSASPTATSRR